mgnify:CR=1 FL=1
MVVSLSEMGSETLVTESFDVVGVVGQIAAEDIFKLIALLESE